MHTLIFERQIQTFFFSQSLSFTQVHGIASSTLPNQWARSWLLSMQGLTTSTPTHLMKKERQVDIQIIYNNMYRAINCPCLFTCLIGDESMLLSLCYRIFLFPPNFHLCYKLLGNEIQVTHYSWCHKTLIKSPHLTS